MDNNEFKNTKASHLRVFSNEYKILKSRALSQITFEEWLCKDMPKFSINDEEWEVIIHSIYDYTVKNDMKNKFLSIITNVTMNAIIEADIDGKKEITSKDYLKGFNRLSIEDFVINDKKILKKEINKNLNDLRKNNTLVDKVLVLSLISNRLNIKK